MNPNRFSIRTRITAGLTLILALAVPGTAQEAPQGDPDGAHNAA